MTKRNVAKALLVTALIVAPIASAAEGIAAWDLLPQGRAFTSAVSDITSSAATKFWVFGGLTGSGWLDSVVQFTISSKANTTLSSTFTTGARGWTSACWDGARYAYIFGGENSGGMLDETWRLDTQANPPTLAQMLDMPGARRATSAVCDGSTYAYVFGGYDGTNFDDQIWRYNIGSNTWTDLSSALCDIGAGRDGTSAVWTARGTAIIYGGRDGGQVYDNVYEFDPSLPLVCVSQLNDMPGPRYGTSATYTGACTVLGVCTEEARVFGGHTGTTYQATIFKHDVDADSWTTSGTSLSSARYGTSAVHETVNSPHDSFVIGGQISGPNYIKNIDEYTWS